LSLLIADACNVDVGLCCSVLQISSSALKQLLMHYIVGQMKTLMYFVKRWYRPNSNTLSITTWDLTVFPVLRRKVNLALLQSCYNFESINLFYCHFLLLWNMSGGVLVWLFVWSEMHIQFLHMAQLISLPFTVSCFCKIQIGFTFLVPAHPDGPLQRATKRVLPFLPLKTTTSLCFLESMWSINDHDNHRIINSVNFVMVCSSKVFPINCSPNCWNLWWLII